MKNLPTEKFLTFVKEKQLFTSEQRILLAVSGGKDSVFMAHLFADAQLDFSIAHCNFKLRDSDSENDKAFVGELAKQFGVKFFCIDFDTMEYAKSNKISTQMAARELRYRWFEDIRIEHGFDRIAIAQHQTDVTETMLLNLIRGTGITGLHGILPKRGNIIRPLLFLDERGIKDCLQENQIKFRVDRSNESLHYKRNVIRNKVLPVLRELNPGLEKTFMANSERFRAAETIVDQAMTELRKKVFIIEKNVVKVPRVHIKEYDNAHLLYELLAPYGFKYQVLNDLLNTDNQPGKKFHSESHTISTDREFIYLTEKSEKTAPAQISHLPTSIEFEKGTYHLCLSDDKSITHQAGMIKVDADLLVLPLQLRCWTYGDTFRPLGMKGRKKVSDFFIQRKIPRVMKDTIPLLVNGNQKILSVGTLQIDETYKITGNTKKVLIFEQS